MTAETTPRDFLVVGGGGREHALLWKLAQSPLVNNLLAAPGNAGTEEIAQNLSRGPKDIDDLVDIAADKNAVVVVGPEDPLILGLGDALREAGQDVFGHNQKAAEIESSKEFSSEFMDRWDIPHARWQSFTEAQPAIEFIQSEPWGEMPVVLKADGPALGKGVLMPLNREEEIAGVEDILGEKKIFSMAGDKLVIQERLEGPEVSVITFVGKDAEGNDIIRPMIYTQDHKRLLDGDEGPNTGGMGSYGPVPMVDKMLEELISRTILEPTVRGMREEGRELSGGLFAGVMLTKDGPKVLEYNVRLGDPETQTQMMVFDDDLAKTVLEVAQGQMTNEPLKQKNGAALTTVMVADGYPGTYAKDIPLEGLATVTDPNVVVFHAGTARNEQGQVVTNGGRVVGVSAYADSLQQASNLVNQTIGSEGVTFKGERHRGDIGWQALTPYR